jgi:hypothetical protein
MVVERVTNIVDSGQRGTVDGEVVPFGYILLERSTYAPAKA